MNFLWGEPNGSFVSLIQGGQSCHHISVNSSARQPGAWNRAIGKASRTGGRSCTPRTRNLVKKLSILLVRADLMIQTQKLLASRGLKQKAVATVLGVTQLRVSDLLRGRIELFSRDALMDMVIRLGVRCAFDGQGPSSGVRG